MIASTVCTVLALVTNKLPESLPTPNRLIRSLAMGRTKAGAVLFQSGPHKSGCPRQHSKPSALKFTKISHAAVNSFPIINHSLTNLSAHTKCPNTAHLLNCRGNVLPPSLNTFRHVLSLAALHVQNMAFAFLLSQCIIQLNRLQKETPDKEKVKLLEISSCFFLTWAALNIS